MQRHWILCTREFPEVTIGAADFLRTYAPDLEVRPCSFLSIAALQSQAVGAIVAAMDESQQDLLVALKGFPIINVAGSIDTPKMPTVRNNERELASRALNHLLSLGHQQLICAVQLVVGSYARRRAETFVALAEDRGLHVQIVPSEDIPFETLSPPVGIFCPNEGAGLTCIHRANACGWKVPHNASVICGGNERAVCEVTRPPMTSIPVDWARIGRRAAARLLEPAQHEASPLLEEVSPAPLIQRDSTSMAIHDPLVRDAVALIASHVHKGINVQEVLDALQISRTSLEKHFRIYLKRSPLEEIHCQRVARANALLLNTDLTIEEIARLSGFSNKARLTAIFTRHTGTSPGAVRPKKRPGK